MGKVTNASDLMVRPFSELSISEQAAVLKARFDEETSIPGTQKIKTKGSIGEEYGLSGSSVGRLLKLNDLIDPLKDMLDRGTLYTKVAIQLAFLPENEQQMVYEVAKETGTKLTVDMAIRLRSHTGTLTDGFVRRYLRKEPIKKKCYKVPGRIIEKYFQGMDPNQVDNIVEQALEAWFRKGAADV
ncbi:hypothetical protein [Butyrivibrio sp. M55]|uniref:hypothetical protein n=1 Tax=Butyrivibrio sp. M55 TaxID=1855323 RepID=UPI0008EDB335|nr:hypothetical protein [Butyrivibrio sp. M55]SFU88668.1 hypothetical protein SAMN05216540_11722 [Butyrivibrio sp. M55]